MERVQRKRHRRDSLRAAAVEHKLLLGKAVLRRWFSNVGPVIDTSDLVGCHTCSSLLSINLLRYYFSEWCQRIPKKKPDLAKFHHQYVVDDYARSTYTRELKETDCYHNSEPLNYASNSMSFNNFSVNSQNSVNSLLTAKPRVPVYLLHPTPTSVFTHDSPIVGNVESLNEDQFVDLTELEKVMTDVEYSLSSARVKNRSNCDLTHEKAEKKKRMAAFLRSYADEIDALRSKMFT